MNTLCILAAAAALTPLAPAAADAMPYRHTPVAKRTCWHPARGHRVKCHKAQHVATSPKPTPYIRGQGL